MLFNYFVYVLEGELPIFRKRSRMNKLIELKN